MTYGERVACTCEPRPDRRPTSQLCEACEAWEQNQVLLQNGTRMAKTPWIQAHGFAPVPSEQQQRNHEEA